MPWKRRISGGLLAVVGFILSPLSWWNDLFVNVPLALAFAWLVSLVYPSAFGVAVVLGYWLTNILGFVLMHKGLQKFVADSPRRYSWQSLLRDVGISLLYTAVIVVLIKLGVLQPIQSYLQKP